MKQLQCLGSLAVLLLAVWTVPVTAQSYLFDLGVNVGGSLHTSMLGADEGFGGGSAKFGTGWLLGSQLTIWPSSRIGLRANFNYADRSLAADADIASHINLWSGSGDLVFRLREPNPSWQGSETLPYIAAGIGRKWINPAGDQYLCYDQPRSEVWECEPFAKDPNANNTFALGEWKESLMLLLGVGADFRLSPRLLARVEVNDRIYTPQVQAVSGFFGGNLYNVPDGEENLSKMIHEFGAQVGLSLAFGMRGETVMAAPPPPPPPVQQQPQPQAPPPAPPAPPPPPRVDDISVCVIDITAAGGMRMQTAQFRHASSDTVVTQAGTTRPLRQTLGSVMTAANAEWYVRGTPFVMTMGQYREEFVTFGQPSTPACNSLVYVGNVNGYPVFVNPNDVSAFRQPLQTAVTAANGDLSAALAGNNQLRTQFDAVRNIYIPLDVVGPRMQQLQRQEQVRKGLQN
jgi:hypothetical protein